MTWLWFPALKCNSSPKGSRCPLLAPMGQMVLRHTYKHTLLHKIKKFKSKNKKPQTKPYPFSWYWDGTQESWLWSAHALPLSTQLSFSFTRWDVRQERWIMVKTEGCSSKDLSLVPSTYGGRQQLPKHGICLSLWPLGTAALTCIYIP